MRSATVIAGSCFTSAGSSTFTIVYNVQCRRCRSVELVGVVSVAITASFRSIRSHTNVPASYVHRTWNDLMSTLESIVIFLWRKVLSSLVIEEGQNENWNINWNVRVFFLNLGHRCRSADVHGNDAYCSSGVVMDTERVKPTVSAG